MALTNPTTLSSKSLCNNPLSVPTTQSHQPTFLATKKRLVHPISAAAAADGGKSPVVAEKPPKAAAPVAAPKPNSGKWSIESWKTKKALQLPEYPDQNELNTVLGTIESFPPIVFAGEARHLEEKIAEAAMGNAFLLQGGDCAESFKEFSANNIRDTFRVMLQMGVVLMFGGQMNVVKVRSRTTDHY